MDENKSMTIDLPEARAMVQAALAQMRPAFAGDEWVIGSEQEMEWGWIFYWGSRKYQETSDFRYAVAGNGPFLVHRNGQMKSACAGRVRQEVADFAISRAASG